MNLIFVKPRSLNLFYQIIKTLQFLPYRPPQQIIIFLFTTLLALKRENRNMRVQFRGENKSCCEAVSKEHEKDGTEISSTKVLPYSKIARLHQHHILSTTLEAGKLSDWEYSLS
jgi:hypothetical protein